MRNLPLILVGVAILLIPVIWFIARSLGPEAPTTAGGLPLTGPAVDSAARIELEDLRQQVTLLTERVQSMESQIDSLRTDIRDRPTDQATAVSTGGPNAIIDSYPQVVQIGSRRKINEGLSVSSPRFLESFLGRPREEIDDTCRAMTNPKLSGMLKLADVGPIKVRMLQPAIESMTRVFENVRKADPDLYARINTAGSLCVRRIRGTQNSLSSHSFGLSVDLNIDGQLDTLGDGKTQLGLTILADFFQEEGWIWGAGFTREDSMHFEVSRELLERWRGQGLI